MAYFECTGGASIEGTASPADVLAGATFMSASSDDTQTGTMPNNGAWGETVTPGATAQEITIPEGYHDGTGKVTVESALTPPAESVTIHMNFCSYCPVQSSQTQDAIVPCFGYSKIKTGPSVNRSAGYGNSCNTTIPTNTEFNTEGLTKVKIGTVTGTSTGGFAGPARAELDITFIP